MRGDSGRVTGFGEGCSLFGEMTVSDESFERGPGRSDRGRKKNCLIDSGEFQQAMRVRARSTKNCPSQDCPSQVLARLAYVVVKSWKAMSYVCLI